MGKESSNKEPNCKRKLNMNDENTSESRTNKRRCMNTAVGVTTQVGTTRQPKVNKQTPKSLGNQGKIKNSKVSKHDKIAKQTNTQSGSDVASNNNNAGLAINDQLINEVNITQQQPSKDTGNTLDNRALPQQTAYERIYEQAMKNLAA